ncbi:EexN family lipoprotein [Nitrosospira sp. NRS527]|uniref:EexN family lipoprotein n=1 Tax=Nitrosospira sp. NRS527 TaxID=155925 RepID=UPI001AF7B121|nr:EexN family lipoprotein [Nitrosospira sp. NRS527]BCT68094.1 hypothetical protein NNRS527_01686 [Nitrosospira sp. NRS527]
MNTKKTVMAVFMAVGALLITTLVGCETHEPQEEVRSVDWYEANAAERAAKLNECKTSPRSIDATPNCVNASRAENNAKADTQWGTSSEGVRTMPTIPSPH